MMRRFLAGILVSGMLLSGCSYYGAAGPSQPVPAPAKEVDRRVTDAGLGFGLKLLEQLQATEPGKNVIISPASISLILSLTLNGAAGETRTEMLQALQMQGLSVEELNRANEGLQTVLANPDPKVKLSLASSIWYHKDYKVQQAMADLAQSAYRAEVKPLDFKAAGSPGQINQWVSKKTQGKIDAIVDKIPADAVMYLINALYFNGTWKKPFNEKATENKPFILSDGSSKQVPLMRVSDKFRYLKADGLEAVALPYGEGRISMYVFLPEKTSSLQAMTRGLTAERWSSLTSQMTSRQGTVELPKVKSTYDVTLNDSLKALGMKKAFDPRFADFSGLLEGMGAGDLVISKVQHKTFMEINERGTEAAAVTSVEVSLTSAPMQQEPPFHMVVDRPFLLAIRDDQTGTVLFLGTVVNP